MSTLRPSVCSASIPRFVAPPDPVERPGPRCGWVRLLLRLGGLAGALLPLPAYTAFYEFAEPTFHVSEEAGVASLDIRRWGDTTLAFSVQWFAMSGTATAGVDFVGVTNNLFFARGETNKTVTIPLRDDGILEEAETVLLRFGASSAGASTGLVNQAVLVIHDNELPSLVDASFNPRLALDDDVFAVLPQADGRILVGGDFTGLGEPPELLARAGVARFMADGAVDLTFAPGDGVGAGVYALALQEDGKVLVGGGFNGNARQFLSRLDGNGTLDATFGTTVNDEIRGIVVQPDGKILIAGRFTEVNGQHHGRIARLHPDGSLDSTFLGGAGANNNIRVLVRQEDGHLLIGGQFTSYDGIGCVRVARLEANGAFDHTFNPGAGANGQVRAIAATPDGRVYLGGDFTTYDNAPRAALVRVLAGGGLDLDFYGSLQAVGTVRCILAQPDGRVLVGGRFEGSWGRARQNLERCLSNGAPDPTLLSDRGPDDEVFALAVQPNGSILIGGQFAEVAGVARAGLARLLPDSRVPLVEYAGPKFFAAEASTQALIPVRRTGESSNEVTVTCFTMPGTAVAGADFTSVTNRLPFAPLRVAQTFSVPVFNEGGLEPPETVRLLLTNAVGVAQGAWQEAQLVILDGFGSGPLQLYPPILYEEGEGGGFLIVRTGPTNLPLSLYYSTRDGTARAGLDYQPVSGTFQLAARETSGYIQVRPINDSLPEGPEEFSLDLRETPGGPVILSCPVTIVDNESGVGFLSLSTEAVVQENAGAVTLYVQCQWDPLTPVEVDYATRDTGTALAGLDYPARAGTLTFQKNGDVQTITVPILNDGRVEGIESFAVVLTAVRGGPVWLGQTNAVITIIDNDEGLEFVTNSVSIGEQEGRATLAVRRRDDGGNTVTVEYTTVDDQATAGQDYTPTSGTLILPPGPGERTFSVPVLDDATVETDETFRVLLRNPTAGASLGPRASAVVRLLDNERPGSLETWFNRPSSELRYGAPAKIALQPDGKILTSIGGTFVRFNASGELDTNFRSGQVFFGAFVPVLQPDGRIIVGSTSSNSLGDNQCVFRLLTNGVLDPSFVAGVTLGHTAAVALQRDGRVLAGGNYDDFSWGSEVSNNGLVRLRADGAIDSSFKAGTFLPRGAYYESPTTVEALALQADGRVVVGGKFTSVAGRPCDRIIRLNADGTSDPSFFCDSAGAASNDGAVVLTLALQPDGKLLAGGTFAKLQGVRRSGLLRLNADGQVDAGFQAPFGPELVVRAVQVQPDGKILVGGGHYLWPEGGSQNFVVRLRADGSLDETFDPGLAPNGAVTDLALLPDGDVLAAGGFTVFNGVNRPGLVRLNGGTVAYSRIALAPTSVTLVEGDRVAFEVRRGGETNWTTSVEFAATAGTATPGEDFLAQQVTLTFAPGETRKLIELAALADGLSESDETLRVGLSNPGNGPTVLLQATAEITILDNNRPGSLDASFVGTIDANSEAQALLVLPDGKILVGGNFAQLNGVIGPGYARLNPDGTLDDTFQRGTGGYDTIRVLARQSDGRILIGGDFKSVLGEPRVGIARLLENGALDSSFQSPLADLGAAAQSVNAIAMVGDRILIGGEFTKVGGQERFAIARLLPNGALDSSFNTPGGVRCGLCGFAGNLAALAPLLNGQVVIGGGFSMVQGKPRRFLARLNADGTLDDTFAPGPGPNGSVTAIIPLANGQLYVAGGFTTMSGDSRSGVVRLEADGSVSPGLAHWSGTDNAVSVLALQPDGRLLIGGYFQTVNGVARPRVARLRPDLSLDESFDPGVSLGRGGETVSALALEAEGSVLVGGNFSLEPVARRYNVARLRGWFAPTLEISRTSGAAGAGITLFTQPGETYALEASTDLIHWIPVQTILASGTAFHLPAPGFAAVPQRFYRARQMDHP